MHNCYEACSQHGQNPTRLVAVNGVHPSLVISSELSGPVEYATLSHCWGNLDILKLKNSNIEEFRQAIPWEKLCKTFQDTCSAVERLGFKYIWIDSLCIIQDSDQDWELESVRMSRVYGNSALNIAASRASDGSMGLFSKRLPVEIETLRLLLPQNSVSEAQITAATSSELEEIAKSTANIKIYYDISRQFQYEECIIKTPLGKRAWAMQERFLAPRTLFFSTQLGWVCQSKNKERLFSTFYCETFPYGPPNNFLRDSHVFYDHTGDPEHWTKVVQEYTSCDLTFNSDRLVAISGIAQKLQHRYKDEYVVGLWKSNLPTHLLWQAVNSSARVTPLTAGRKDFTPPSWSWASHGGRVFWYSELFDEVPPMEKLFKIKSVSTALCGSSPFGDVKTGELILRSPYLVPFTFSEQQSDEERNYNLDSLLRIILGRQGNTIGQRQLASWVRLHCGESKDFTGKLFLFAGALMISPIDRTKTFLMGLVLQATQNKQGEYRRIGFFAALKNDYERGDREELMNFLNEGTKPDQSDYIGSPEVDEKGRSTYAVIIV